MNKIEKEKEKQYVEDLIHRLENNETPTGKDWHWLRGIHMSTPRYRISKRSWTAYNMLCKELLDPTKPSDEEKDFTIRTIMCYENVKEDQRKAIIASLVIFTALCVALGIMMLSKITVSGGF